MEPTFSGSRIAAVAGLLALALGTPPAKADETVSATAPGAPAAGNAGHFNTTFTLGATALTYGLTTAKLTTVADTVPFSEFIGAGYFITDRLRVALNLQFTEALTVPSAPPPSRFTVFALLPQVNYTFAKPFFASLVAFVPFRFGGVDQVGIGVQGVVGASFPIGKELSLSAAIEVPWVMLPVETLAVTPLIGLAYRL
ncbi:MAG: hypothetical protein ACYDCL_00165 [Myxococcales bacterium]